MLCWGRPCASTSHGVARAFLISLFMLKGITNGRLRVLAIVDALMVCAADRLHRLHWKFDARDLLVGQLR